MAQGHIQCAAAVVVLDAVFHQVKDNLIEIILQNENGAVLLQGEQQPDISLLGQGREHPLHPPDGGGQVDDLAFHRFLTVHFGQGQQLCRHAVQPLGLIADIPHKFPDGVHIHIVLQDGIRQQLDGGQGSFQLVGGIGDKPPPFLLGGVQPLGQVVDLIAQNGQLVIAAHGDLVGVVPLLNDPDGGHDLTHPAGKGGGKGQGEQKHDDLQNQSDLKHRQLQGVDQGTLGGVVIGHIHTADDGAVIGDGCCGVGVHNAAAVFPGEYVISLGALVILPQGL